MAITLPFATFSRHEDGEWSETTIGTPQWAVVSPLLANLLPTPRFRSMDRGTRGLRLRGSAARLAMYRRDSVLPSPSDDRVGDLSSWFSKLNTLPVAVPVYASDRTSRCAPQDSGSGWIRCSFPVGLFHSLLHAVYPGAPSPPTSQSRQATELSTVRLSVLQILGKLLRTRGVDFGHKCVAAAAQGRLIGASRDREVRGIGGTGDVDVQRRVECYGRARIRRVPAEQGGPGEGRAGRVEWEPTSARLRATMFSSPSHRR